VTDTNATFLGAVARSIQGRAAKSAATATGTVRHPVAGPGRHPIWLMDGNHVQSVSVAGSFNPESDWHIIA
jgi:hypothetical protein